MRTRLAFLSISMVFALGCGITVLVPNETGEGLGGSSVGGSGGGGGAGITTTTSIPTAPNGCSVACSVLPANQTCSCTHDCDGSFPPAGKVSCAPIVDLQGTHKIECVCTVGDEFSGVCFEKNEAVLCDFDEGCCAKYFSGK